MGCTLAAVLPAENPWCSQCTATTHPGHRRKATIWPTSACMVMPVAALVHRIRGDCTGCCGGGRGGDKGAALWYHHTQSSAHGLGQRHVDGFYDMAVCAGHKWSHMGETVSRVQHGVQSVCYMYNRMCSADGGADSTATLYVRHHTAVTTMPPHATPQCPPTTFTPPFFFIFYFLYHFIDRWA